MRPDSLIKGTVILAAAAFVARFLGMIVRAPLLYLLEEEAMASYVIANNIYLNLLIVATAGLPSAVSKLISENHELGREAEAGQIYRAAVWFAICAGVIVTVILYGFAPFYAQLSGNPDSTMAIRALAPALLLFPVIAIMRGYFQGRRIMKAGAVSQMIEQFARVGSALLIAYVMIQIGISQTGAAAGASFGGVLGSIAAFSVMVYYWRKIKKMDASERLSDQAAAEQEAGKLSKRAIYKMLFRLSIPISLISMMVPLINTIDSTLTIPLLRDQLGVSEATVILGLLGGKAQPLAGIPPILAIALSMSIVPIVSAAYAKKDMQEVSDKASQALRISVLSGLPVVLILIVAARPLNGFLFPDFSGTDLIIWVTASVMFQVIMTTAASILMGMGKTTPPMLFVGLGVLLKIIASVILANWFGIYGILAATGMAFILTMSLNVIWLRKVVKLNILGRKWFGVGLAGAIVLGVLVPLESWMHEHAMWFGVKLSTALHLGVIGIAGLVIYVLVLSVTGVVEEKDVARLPSPVLRLYKKLQSRFGRKQA